jgi:hypothetical protein
VRAESVVKGTEAVVKARVKAVPKVVLKAIVFLEAFWSEAPLAGIQPVNRRVQL